MAYIEVRDVTKVFDHVSGQARIAIQGISCSIDQGERVCIVGRTGCGKSTLMALLMGLEVPTSGSVSIGGLSPTRDFLQLRGRLAAVFQTDRLLPWRTAIDNAAVGLEILGVPRAERLRRSREWLERLGLCGYDNAYPHELSGGMRQRVALARGFVIDPELLLLDEAFGHLDEVTAGQLRADFMRLLRSTPKTAILVTHNIEEAIELGDRILVLARPARTLEDIRLQDCHRRGAEALRGLRARIAGLIGSDEEGGEAQGAA